MGKSDTPKKRYYSHLCDPTETHKACWIRSLLREGLAPKLVIYAEVREEAWQEAERLLIAGFRQMGYDLTNTTEGGDGVNGYKSTEEQRQRNSETHKGKRWSEETRRKFTAARVGMKHIPCSEERKRKLREAFKGTHHSEETKRKLSEIGMGHVVTEETRRKISESKRGRNLGKKMSEETKRKLRESAKIRWGKKTPKEM